MHLRAALKELEKDGVIPPGSSKGKLGNKTITRARG
jgi:hypothetical protein